MALELAEIRNLRIELKRDLDALARVEALLLRQKTLPATPVYISKSSRTRSAGRTARSALRDLVMQVLEQSKKPLRPTEIVNIAAAKGYPFASIRKGMGTVTSVLARHRGKGKIEKLPDGTYISKSNREK